MWYKQISVSVYSIGSVTILENYFNRELSYIDGFGEKCSTLGIDKCTQCVMVQSH